MEHMPPVTIHLARLGKPERVFTEGLLGDDGVRLKTFTIVPEAAGRHLAENFQRQGLTGPGSRIAYVSKYHFYNEYFSIIHFQAPRRRTLGYYCDIVTPLERKGSEYYLTDLILDLWVTPDLAFMELDWDEFEAAVGTRLIPPDLEAAALNALNRLKTELARGDFPFSYMC